MCLLICFLTKQTPRQELLQANKMLEHFDQEKQERAKNRLQILDELVQLEKNKDCMSEKEKSEIIIMKKNKIFIYLFIPFLHYLFVS
jgi:hypothetical protein